MKREDLQKIEGLTKEQIDSIMNVHQQDVATWTTRISTLETDKTTMEAKLKPFEGVDLTAINQQIADLEKDKLTLETEKATITSKNADELAKIRLERELDKRIYKENPIDPVAFRAHLKIDGITYDEEKQEINGFDEQLEKIKTDCGYLFTPITTGIEHSGINNKCADVELSSALQEKYK